MDNWLANMVDSLHVEIDNLNNPLVVFYFKRSIYIYISRYHTFCIKGPNFLLRPRPLKSQDLALSPLPPVARDGQESRRSRHKQWLGLDFGRERREILERRVEKWMSSHMEPFSEKFKNSIWKFLKIGIKNTNVYNNDIYYYAKNQSKTRYIIGSTKMTNLYEF
jgi:hypothetical protein